MLPSNRQYQCIFLGIMFIVSWRGLNDAQDYDDIDDITFYESDPRYSRPLTFYETEVVDLIENFENKIKEDMEDDLDLDTLTYNQDLYVGDRLGLYKYLVNHPTLLNRRFQVSTAKAQPPHFNPSYMKTKRSFEIGMAKPACPYHSGWRRITFAHDINDTLVKVYQPKAGSEGHQWFYTVTCDKKAMSREDPRCPKCCFGINHHRYSSRCISKKSYVMALVKKPHEHKYKWNWIQVDTSCSCAITEKQRG